jgi:hypothetical protein
MNSTTYYMHEQYYYMYEQYYYMYMYIVIFLQPFNWAIWGFFHAHLIKSILKVWQ